MERIEAHQLYQHCNILSIIFEIKKLSYYKKLIVYSLFVLRLINGYVYVRSLIDYLKSKVRVVGFYKMRDF